MKEQGYVVKDKGETPLHLRGLSPFKLANTEIMFQLPEERVLDEAGRVLLPGAIEFQSRVTPWLLTDICDPHELYRPEHNLTHRFRSVYDPEIQRGVKDTQPEKGQHQRQFLREVQVDSMMQDIMENSFDCPNLMWNLRGGETTWVYVRDLRELQIFQGVATRPDTNHRHHAIIRVHRKYIQFVQHTGKMGMDRYNPDRQYSLIIYTDTFDGEARRFYVYNTLGWRVSTSTAYYIESKTESPLLHTKLARELMDMSGTLNRNVEVLNSQVSRNSAKMITFGTLVDALKGAFPIIDDDDYLSLRTYLLGCLAELHRLLPDEIGLLSVSKRQRVREKTVADQAVLWHAYFRLAALAHDIGIDLRQALNGMRHPVRCLRRDGTWYQGDPLARENPAWQEKGVIVPGKKGLRVSNTRESRQGAFDYLCEITGVGRARPSSDQ